jgi:hypothetical protein
MSADKQRQSAGEDEQRPAKRKDAGAGSDSVGAVDGIGGAGGASGAGSVRAKVRAVGDISGIDAVDDGDVPAPGSVGKGKAGSRTRQMSDGGLSGQTRGAASESVPNQEGANQQDAEKTNPSHHHA